MKVLATLFLLLASVSGAAAADEGPNFTQTRDWIMQKFNRYNMPYENYNGGTIGYYNRRGDATLDIGPCKVSTYLADEFRGSDGVHHSGMFRRVTGLQLVYLTNISVTSNGAYPDIMFRTSVSSAVKEMKAFWNSSVRRENTDAANIFFNYNGQEPNMEQRMRKAFFHLRDLARKNPACGYQNNEAF